MAATGRRSNGSSVLCPLSSSHHHRHQRSSASPCNINIRLKRFSLGNNPNNPSAAVSNQKRRCSCSPTTHPGSFRCGFHRRLENERIETLASSNKSSKSGSGPLYLRKLALVNSLARIGSVEAERFRKYLTESMVKPSSLFIRRRFEFRPRLSRFCVMRKDPKG
ncbi:Serine-rich protein-like protein [Hirschfeldia incana]|nr:Serine-rich protein-like protein [Hirschfeldia incana]